MLRGIRFPQRAAPTLEEERPIPNYYVDQLIAAEDVSDEIFAATDQAKSDTERQPLRQRVIAEIQERLERLHQGGEGTVRVEVTALYNGGRYSAYTYRRYTDVRLVAAAELQMGFFGGDGDNFTYPRYALDFAFMRVYGNDGEPLKTDHYFSWSEEGVEEGSVVFVIGNPGPTNRLNTVAQLEFQRDVSVAANKAFLGSRLSVMRDFFEAHPTEGEAMGLRNTMFGISNSLKANTGRLEALGDPSLMARKADGERLFREAMAADAILQERFGGLVDEVATIQEQKAEVGAEYGAFANLGRAGTESSLLRRALNAVDYLAAVGMNAPADTLEAMKRRILRVGDGPEELEEALLRERLQDFSRYLGPDHPITEVAMGGRSVEGAVTKLRSRSILTDQEGATQALEGTGIPPDDPAIALVQAILPAYADFSRSYNSLIARERELAAELGRARYAVYGADVPPDASRSPGPALDDIPRPLRPLLFLRSGNGMESS
jgi:hypothetical protein